MFEYKGNNEKIIEATKKTNDKSLIESVTNRISKKPYYDMSNMNGKELSKWFSNVSSSSKVEIKTYRPKWRFSKAMGYYSGGDEIFINQYKLPSISEVSLISLFYHEFGHYVDNQLDHPLYANHGDNSSKNKENTFQYSLNRYVNDYFNKDKTNKDDTQIKKYVPWYKRFFKKLTGCL